MLPHDLKKDAIMFDSLKNAYLPEMELPVRTVDPAKCTKCGRCYRSCPTYGYQWRKGEVPHPAGFGGFEQACINCGNCIAVCPVDAIAMTGCFSIRSGRYKGLLEKRMAPPDPTGAGTAKRFKALAPELTGVERGIYTRRSNRIFREKPVPRELLHRILEAGRFAPSAGNCQPYRFIVITNQKVIKEFERRSMKILRRLKNLYMSKNGKRSLFKTVVFSIASYLMINKMDPRPITAMEKADRCDNKMFFDAPAVILVLKDKRGVSNPDLDAGICSQNMVLAAHSLGLGTCYVSLPMTPLASPLMSGFRKRIGIVPPFEAVTSLAVGYAKGKIDGPVVRDTPGTRWIA
jgi:nitroreductase/NAD-dependent dihydropyrimidine dehydrogenase PreA subunit